MDKIQAAGMIRDLGLIAIIRAHTSEDLIQAAEAILTGGVKVIEVTMTTPNALDVIAKASERLGKEILLGAGTVLDEETARAALLAGAQFIISPTLNPKTVMLSKRYGKVVIAGCFSPTEILTAWEIGADFIKVFPADLGGPSYIKAILAPLPQIPLIPTGGVTVETAGPFLQAGAVAVAAGSALVSPKILNEKDFSTLTKRARQFRKAVERARQPFSRS